MSIEYAKAYGNERRAHAATKRLQREAIRDCRDSNMGNAGYSLRNTVGDHLITLGLRLNRSSSPSPLATNQQ